MIAVPLRKREIGEARNSCGSLQYNHAKSAWKCGSNELPIALVALGLGVN